MEREKERKKKGEGVSKTETREKKTLFLIKSECSLVDVCLKLSFQYWDLAVLIMLSVVGAKKPTKKGEESPGEKSQYKASSGDLIDGVSPTCLLTFPRCISLLSPFQNKKRRIF